MVKSYPNHNKIAALIPNSVSGPFYTFFSSKTAFFTGLYTVYFEIQEITFDFTFPNGGSSREW